MAESAAQSTAAGRSIDDVMLAMDVVDTLRHRQLLIERELNAYQQQDQLIERLKAIYAAQGIDVPEHVLFEGVAALKEDRFRYTRPPSGLAVSLAGIYVKRQLWLRPLVIVVVLIAIVWLGYSLLVSGPRQREVAALPTDLVQVRDAILDSASSSEAPQRAEQLYATGMNALSRDDLAKTRSALEDLRALEAQLNAVYELHVVSRANERSGFWRVPDMNTSARNYYVVVQAIGPRGDVLPQSIRNEEDGQHYVVAQWGLRVSEGTYAKVAADKRDDGIIQNRLVAIKRRGELTPNYLIPSTGATVTKW